MNAHISRTEDIPSSKIWGTVTLSLQKAWEVGDVAIQALLRPASSRPIRMMLVFIALPAMLIGLLVLHAFVSDTAHGPTAHATPSSELSPAAHSDGPLVDCDEHCNPTHDMVELACGFALFAASALVAFPAPSLSWNAETAIEVHALSGVESAELQPPQLHLLSISRT